MAPTLKQINTRLGSGSSRKGLCNSPHPDPKYLVPATPPAEGWAPTVRCSRFAEHDGDCAAYAFSINKPDTWPKPLEGKPE